MFTFSAKAPKNSVIIFPLFQKDFLITSRKLFEGLTMKQRKAVKKVLQQSMPIAGTIPVYTNDGLVIICLYSQSIDDFEARKEGEKIISLCKKYQQENIFITKGSFYKNEKVFEAFIDGVFLGEYSFEEYKGRLKTESLEKNPEIKIKKITINSKKNPIRENWTTGVQITKDIINTPPSVATPEFVEKKVRKDFEGIPNVKITSLKEKELKDLGAGGILAVGQETNEESRFLIIEYFAGKKGENPIGFVGKGVTYDTGGLSLKPAIAMKGMKKDLGGAATIIGAVYAMVKSGVKKNIVAVIPLAENAIGKNAYKPDDIVTMMNGKTVEITNTDAEGRLLLGDALCYIEKIYTPAVIIDAATLTGACAYAVGEDIGAVFSNNEELFDALLNASEKTSEYIWRLPLHSRYEKMIHSRIADLVNAAYGFKAGTIQAALFLQHFVHKNTPWIHLDIAYSSFDNTTDFATGMHVRMLFEFVKKR